MKTFVNVDLVASHLVEKDKKVRQGVQEQDGQLMFVIVVIQLLVVLVSLELNHTHTFIILHIYIIKVA